MGRTDEISATRIHRKVQEAYSDDTMGVSAILKCTQRFRIGSQRIWDEPRSERTKTRRSKG